ncbi:MAG: hypothetical protein VB064_14725, partial [Oscillospiraceae bacterium]|nr:hypothetical protein [Oscillospiraceae bacterium]
MKKRYFALLLALIFFLGMFPAPAYSAEGDAVWESLTLPDGTELEASGEETISLWGIYDITCYTVEVPTVTDAVYLYDDNAYFDGSGVGLATQYTMADGSSYYDSGYPWNITKTGDHFEISMNYDGHNLLDTEPGASASDSGYLLVRVPYSSGATDPAECYFIRFVEKGEARGVDTGEIDPEDYAIWDRIEAYGDDSFDSWAQEDNGIPYYTQDTLEVGGTEYLYYTVYLPENTYDLYLIDEQLYDPEGDSSVFATQLVLGDGKPSGWRDESSADYSGYWDLYNCGAGTISPGSVGFSSIDDPGSLYSGYTGCAFNLFAENPVVMDEEMGSYWNGNEDFYTWPEDNNGYPLLRVAYGPDSSAFDQCYYVRFVQGSLVHPETDVPPVRDGDYYQIYTEEQFQWFRDQVNGGNTGINALLMNSIALSEEWTPIGTAEHPFAGTFNGSGRYVTNLSIDSEADYQGLFGYVSGSVLNIRVTGSVAGGDYVGGVAGYVSATGTLGGGNGCWNLCAVSGTGEHVGGVAGINQGTALSCTNYGAVNGAAETGSGNVSNSKAFFTVNSIAVTGTPKLAYASGETLDVSGLAVTASVTATGANGATFAYQIPLSHLTLSPAAGTALNEQGSVTVTVSYGGKTATFTCNVTDGGKWDGSTMSEPAQAEGVYQIGSAAELAWFANEVNNEERRDIDALLIDDIDLNGKQWTPIGAGYAYNDETGDSSTRYGIIDDTAYMGTFDGGGKTISGLYISTVPEVETADQRKNGNRPLHYETYCQGLFGIIGKEGSVKNLTVDGEVLANATGTFYVNAAHYVGGIAGINMGLIVNCVNEADITGHVYVGGIAGEVGAQTAGQIKVAGRVLNCANYGDVTGTAWSSTNAGGITGQLAYGKLQYVENHGNVSAPYYDPSGFAEYARSVDIGGIAGESVNDPASPTFIDRAWNSGSISAPEGGNRKAGIVGLVQQCTITNVYNTGTVSDCYYYSGGLAGFLYSGSVTNGYSTATVTKYSTSVGNQSGLLVGRASNGTLLKSLYYAASSTKPLHYAESSKPSYTVENVEARTSITASILGGAFIDGVPLPVLDMADAPTGETEIWSVDAIDLENGRITVTLDKKLTSTNLTLDDLLIHAKVNNAATTLTGLSLSQDNSGAATVVTITFDKVMAEAELYVSVVDVSETITTPATDSWLDYRASAFESGSGAKNDPYIIVSAEQLALLAWQVTDQRQDTAGKYYKLGDDINLAGRLWTRIGYATMLSENVYTGGKAFNGTFDGDNRDISNLTIQTNQDFFGLFGVIGQAGVVKNVNIASGSVTATASNYGGLGAIAGVNYGVIYHCTNAADVSGIRDVGGIAGISGAVNKTITTSLIYRCGNTGAVSGTRDVGGVTSFNAGTVSECYNTGAVEATNVTFGVAGGVVGYHYEGGAFLDSSYNIGSVTGKYAGGVASKVLDNVVRDCYSSGAVSGEGSGGLVGYTVGYYSVRNSYYLASAAPMPYGDNSGTGFEAKGTLEDLAALLGSAFQNGGPAPQLLWQTEDPGDLADETNGLAISALEVKNGYLTITMNKRLMMTQLVQSDFTVTGVTVTGIESRISGGVTVVTLKFNVIPAAAAEQNINISVAYGGGAVNGTLTVEADPSVVPPVYEAAGNWIDNAAAGYASGNGSVGSPYIINTAEQLAYLANQVNGSEGVNGNSQSGRYFQLGADINLTAKYWTPIGVNMGNCFSGHFDGAGP